MKNILILTDFYYPYPSANGVCMGKIADALIKKGHKVYVVAFGIGNTKKYESIKGSKVYRVKAPLFYQIREKKKEIGGSKILFNIFRAIRHMRVITYLYRYPSIYPLFANRYSRCVNKLVKKEHIHEVIAEYVPIEAVYAGIKAKKCNKDLGFKVYVVDTFTQCPNALNHKIIKKVSQKWEKRIIEECDGYYYIDNYREYYSKKEFENYTHKMHAIGLPLIFNNFVPGKTY